MLLGFMLRIYADRIMLSCFNRNWEGVKFFKSIHKTRNLIDTATVSGVISMAIEVDADDICQVVIL